MPLFHYTDINAVEAILKNKKIWLTDIRYMNDARELHDGIEVFLDVLNRVDIV